MATIEYKAGNYQVRPSSSQQFTFWWGDEGSNVFYYFDVSIRPDINPNQPSQLSLVEEQRAFVLDTSESPSGKYVLLLTLRNDNNSVGYFTANHVRIY